MVKCYLEIKWNVLLHGTCFYAISVGCVSYGYNEDIGEGKNMFQLNVSGLSVDEQV